MISELAFIHPSAKLAEDVKVGPWTFIGENVEIGAGSVIDSHTIIKKNTRIGKNNHIFSHAVLGTDPQHLEYRGEETWLELGDNNVVREFATINRGTKETGVTKIGSNTYLMAYIHVAHDCEIEDNVIFINNASIAGHVTIKHHAILGPFSAVHQFARIGEYSFLGRGAKVSQDILPYMLVTGNPGVPKGLNSVGLRRHNFSSETIQHLKKAFLAVYRSEPRHQAIVEKLQPIAALEPHVANMLHAFSHPTKRGVARHGGAEDGEA